MTFLNPLVLLGLAAAAIPVILHLLNRRKLRTVEFSSLRFLKELQNTSLRRLKLRQWLLLVLRTSLIIALVLSFARPVIHGNVAGIFGSRARTSMVMVVDDSPSMTVRTERGMVFDRAREAASRILALAGDGDRIAVLPLSTLAPGASTPAYEQAEVAKSVLQRLEPSQIARRFSEAVPAIRAVVQASRDANREVYLFTDAQASQFAAHKARTETTAVFDKDVRFFLIRPNTSLPVNAGVTGARIDTRFLAQNRAARILIGLKNFSDTPINQETVSLYLDGARVAQQSVDLPPRGSAVVPISFVPKRTGILTGHAAIDDDGLEADNTLHFVLAIPEMFNVLVAGPATDDVRYPLLALTLGGDTLTAGRVDAHRIPAEQLPLTDLSRTPVLLLNGINTLTPAEGTATVDYVRRGGNVILFPGADVNASSFNDLFWKPLGLPGMSPAVTAGTPEGSRQESFLSFTSVDRAHPLFAGLFDEQRKGNAVPVESPKIYRTAGLRPGGGVVPIITLSNGEPFLAEYEAGKGRVLAFAVDPGTAWSDFPLKGVFAPLLHRAVAYCSVVGEQESTATVGTSLRFAVRSGETEASRIHVVVSPAGLEERVTPRTLAGTGSLEFLSSPTNETGVYLLRQGAQGSEAPVTLAARAVAVPPWEGDLDTLRQEDLPAFWSALGIGEEKGKLLRVGESLERTIQENRYGLELWRYFLGFAVLCAFAEMLAGRERRTTGEPR